MYGKYINGIRLRRREKKKNIDEVSGGPHAEIDAINRIIYVCIVSTYSLHRESHCQCAANGIPVRPCFGIGTRKRDSRRSAVEWPIYD